MTSLDFDTRCFNFLLLVLGLAFLCAIPFFILLIFIANHDAEE